MKFLVLGSSGMAGHTIAIYLKEQGHEVVGFSRKPVPFLNEQFNGDAMDSSLVRKVVESCIPDVIVNCIGVLNQFAEGNPVCAKWLNGGLPHYLAEICEDTTTRIFHMSTDCVFAGNGGPYTEESVPDGESVYDKSKAAGELLDNRNMTFRNSIVGPDMNPAGIGLFNWFMQQQGTVRGWTHALWTGLTTLELAKAMECAASCNCYGLVNMVPEGNISKYDLLRLFNSYCRGGELEVVPDDTVTLDKTLVRTRFDCPYMPASYERQIAELSDWILLHRNLYPHYKVFKHAHPLS